MKEYTLLQWAQAYVKAGWSIIPINPTNKAPHSGLLPRNPKTNKVEWEPYKTRQATPEELQQWFNNKTDKQVGIGIVVGKVSNVSIVDVDEDFPPEFFAQLPPTRVVKTGKGYHYYYKYTPNTPNLPQSKHIRGVDVKTNGGYCVAPPSYHASTKRNYIWLDQNEKIADFPDDIVNVAKDLFPPKHLTPNGKGGRNNALTSYCGALCAKTPQDKWADEIPQKMIEANEKFMTPPLPVGEVKTIYDSISSKAKEKGDGLNTKSKEDEKLINLVLGSCEIFSDTKGQAFARVKMNDHYENHKCSSKRFKGWVSALYYKEYKKFVSPDKIRTLTMFLEHQSAQQSPQDVDIRIQKQNDTIYYDLGTPDWNCVVVKQPPRITEQPPCLFKREGAMSEQVKPDLDNPDLSLSKLDKYINVMDEATFILFRVALVTAFVPDIPRPMFFFYGQQGSAKSTASKICKKIIDPSSLSDLSFPAKEEELVQVLSQHYAIFFDNVSKVSPTRSDTLCRAITGGGFAKRELYTNDETIVYQFKRMIGLNGIDTLVDRADLLERSILFEMKPIDVKERKTEKKLWKEFDKDLPHILGAIFIHLSRAIKRVKELNIEKLPRMADFVLWGYAIAEEMGIGGDKFLTLYNENQSKQNVDLVNDNPFASMLYAYVEREGFHEGKTSDFYEQFNVYVDVETAGGDKSELRKDQDWPKNAQSFVRLLKRYRVAFEDMKLKFEIYTKRHSFIKIWVGDEPIEAEDGKIDYNGVVTNLPD